MIDKEKLHENIGGVLSSAQTSSLGLGTDHDVYDKRLNANPPWPPFTRVPRFIYFYYVRVEPNGDLVVNHYDYHGGPDPTHPVDFAPIPHAQVPTILEHLTTLARPGGGGGAPRGNNFERIMWTRISYIAIVIDEEKWSFQQRANGDSAISFVTGKGNGRPNCSFFDAADRIIRPFDVQSNTVIPCSCAYFVNHMKVDSAGTEITNEPDQNFFFNMYFDVKYTRQSTDKMTVILDPGGTNQGPPEDDGHP